MKIGLMGDVMLGRLVNERLRSETPEYVWGDVLPLMALADFRLANLECVLADGGAPWPRKAFHFRSDTKNVACLEAAAINVVGLANNHTLDFGPAAFREMLPVLDAHGILHVGAGRDVGEARRPAISTCRGTSIGIVAATDNEPGWAATSEVPGVFYAPTDLTQPPAMDLVALVREIRPAVGVLIVSLHWGGNWGEDVPPDHVALAHALVEAGADVVFGHSAHIFRGVEVYRGQPVIYSAGDFVDDYAVDPVERNDQSFFFLLEVSGRSRSTLRLYPTVIEDFRVRLAAEEARPIAAKMQRLSAELGTTATWLGAERCLEIRC